MKTPQTVARGAPIEPPYTATMRTSPQTLDATYLQMRERVLSLAADFDRVLDRDDGVGPDEARVSALRDCVRELLSDEPGRAARVQLRLSDPL
jgi:hypothetical protein